MSFTCVKSSARLCEGCGDCTGGEPEEVCCVNCGREIEPDEYRTIISGEVYCNWCLTSDEEEVLTDETIECEVCGAYIDPEFAFYSTTDREKCYCTDCCRRTRF